MCFLDQEGFLKELGSRYTELVTEVTLLPTDVCSILAPWDEIYHHQHYSAFAEPVFGTDRWRELNDLFVSCPEEGSRYDARLMSSNTSSKIYGE